MLNTIRKFFLEYPDKRSFFLIILTIFPRFSDEHLLVEKAYTIAKDEFRGKFREEGVRYFEHLRAVALILILVLKIKDVNIIVAALLHDIVENIKSWDHERVRSEFNKEIASLVFMVSKKDKCFFEGSKTARNLEFNRRMLRISRKAALIKLADRLHNIMTLWATSKKKQFRIIRDTYQYYLKLAIHYNILVEELKLALVLAVEDLADAL